MPPLRRKDAGGNYDLAVSEIDLAARAGLSRKPSSRVMHELKGKKLALINGTKITIPNLDLSNAN